MRRISPSSRAASPTKGGRAGKSTFFAKSDDKLFASESPVLTPAHLSLVQPTRLIAPATYNAPERIPDEEATAVAPTDVPKLLFDKLKGGTK